MWGVARLARSEKFKETRGGERVLNSQKVRSFFQKDTPKETAIPRHWFPRSHALIRTRFPLERRCLSEEIGRWVAVHTSNDKMELSSL
jgi:hypothetical protein